MKKKSIFKKIFSSNKECCSVEIEEVVENKNQNAPNLELTTKHDTTTCCSEESTDK